MMGRLRKSQIPLLALSEFPFSYKNKQIGKTYLCLSLHSSPSYTKFTKHKTTHAMSYSVWFGPCHSISVCRIQSLLIFVCVRTPHSLLLLLHQLNPFKFWTSFKTFGLKVFKEFSLYMGFSVGLISFCLNFT